MEKICKECGSELKGRSDKKFCDDQCRSCFNNRNRREKSAAFGTIDKILKKNYWVLKKLGAKANIIVDREQMLMLGFNFRYQTQQLAVYHQTLHYCYDLAYTYDQNNDIVILGYKNSTLALRKARSCHK